MKINLQKIVNDIKCLDFKLRYFILLSLILHLFILLLMRSDIDKEIYINKYLPEKEQQTDKDINENAYALQSNVNEFYKDLYYRNSSVPQKFREREFNVGDILNKDCLYTLKYISHIEDLFNFDNSSLKYDSNIIEKEKDNEVNELGEFNIFLISNLEELYQVAYSNIVSVTANDRNMLLRLSNSELDKYLDDIILKNKIEQFIDVKNEFLSQYNPDDKVLAQFINNFYEKNIARYNFFQYSNKFILLYTLNCFEEQLYEKEFFDYGTNYIKKYPGTKTAVEFLFIIADILTCHFETLEVLKASYPIAIRDKQNPLSDIIILLYDKYTAIMYKYNINFNNCQTLYNKSIKYILQQVIEINNNNYRVNDAKFIIGILRWQGGQQDEAINIWKDIELYSNDTSFKYVEIYNRIFRVINVDRELLGYDKNLIDREISFIDWYDDIKLSDRNRNLLWDEEINNINIDWTVPIEDIGENEFFLKLQKEMLK